MPKSPLQDRVAADQLAINVVVLLCDGCVRLIIRVHLLFIHPNSSSTPAAVTAAQTSSNRQAVVDTAALSLIYALVLSVFLIQYDPESAPALALKATMNRTENRFANYAKAGLLCGADGLPHLISDPGLALKYGHAGEVFVSTKAWVGGGAVREA